MRVVSRRALTEVSLWVTEQATMGKKSVSTETLGSRIRYLSVFETFHPLPPDTKLISLFLRQHRPSTYTTLNWGMGGGGGIRKLMLDSNKIEQALQYRKVSFSKSLSTTSVIHCSSCKMVKILVQIMDNVQNVTSIFQTVFQLFSSLYPGTTQSLTIYI